MNNTGLGVTRNSLHWDCLSLGRFLKRNESQGHQLHWISASENPLQLLLSPRYQTTTELTKALERRPAYPCFYNVLKFLHSMKA